MGSFVFFHSLFQFFDSVLLHSTKLWLFNGFLCLLICIEGGPLIIWRSFIATIRRWYILVLIIIYFVKQFILISYLMINFIVNTIVIFIFVGTALWLMMCHKNKVLILISTFPFFLFHFHLQFNQWPLCIGQIAFHDFKLKTLLTAIDRMLSFVRLIFVAAFNLCNA